MNYTSPPGYHRHSCPWCGFVWEHADANDRHHGSGGAHTCPACTKCSWGMGIYEGPEAPRITYGVMPDVRPKEVG